MSSNYIFPFDKINKGESIVLYGAGNVGQCFYKQISRTSYAEVAAWVDKNYLEYQKLHYPVSSVETIRDIEFDWIIIAIDNDQIAYEVKEILTRDFSIPEAKLVYSSGYRFVENGIYENIWEEKRQEVSLEEISPKQLLTINRLDLAVRYLIAKDILFGVENPANTSLYCRMILIRTGANEGKGYFSEYERIGTSEYIDAIKKLADSMRKEGFNKEYAIPLGSNGVFLNGAHRVATALALEENIWISKYGEYAGATDFSISWFYNNGFTNDDIIRILRGYGDLYEECGIMVLFAPCIELWDYLQAQIAKDVSIVGSVELDFSDNYIAFENIIHDIYEDMLWRNAYIDRKLELLKMAPLKMRVLLVSDEGFTERDIYKTIENMKLDIRDRMRFDIDIAPVVIHGSNTREEYNHLKQILLSVNNLRWLRRRIARNYSEDFVERLNRLKVLLQEKGISQEKTVISGSSSWEIMGLRKAVDLDFIVDRNIRNKYGNETVSWEDDIEYVRKDSIEVSPGCVYTDEMLVNDDNYHFVFNGLKFVNMDLIARKKAFTKREKDVRDIRLYELFNDYAKNFDDKAFLKKQIENEFYKKR